MISETLNGGGIHTIDAQLKTGIHVVQIQGEGKSHRRKIVLR